MAFFILTGLVSAAQFPFQAGLLRASTAPLPVSVLLQSVTLVNAGLYLILRLSPLFMNTWLARILVIIGAFSFAAAALLALMQNDVKRIFTFSTISMAGLTIVLACLANLQAIYAALLLVLLHGITKALLFFCAGGNSASRLSAGLTLLAALAMVMPPFGIPLVQWTAFMAAVYNPAALILIIAGSVFFLLVWARFIAKRLDMVSHTAGTMKLDPLYMWPQLGLAAGVVTSGLFSVPLTNFLITPVLKENYRRFSDIAQGDAISFLLRDFAGINPLLVFALIAAVVGTGWLLLRWLADRPAIKNVTEPGDIAALPEAVEVKPDAAIDALPVAESGESEAAVSEVAVKPAEIKETADAQPVLHFPTRSILSIFPDASQTQLYATVIGGALIILMFEVVIR
jgi:ech hydrogenase subunit A